MKLLVAALFTALAVMLYLPAGADDNGAVQVDITPKVIAITVDTASVSYLDVELGVDNIEPDPAGFKVTNNGTGDVDLRIRGDNTKNADDSLGWTLASLPGDETYVHRFATATDPGPTDFTPLTLGLQSLFSAAVAPLGAIDVTLNLATPTETTHFGPQTTTVEVVATDAAP